MGRKPGQVVRAGVSQTLEGRRIFAELTVDQNLAVGGMSRRNDQPLKDRRSWILDLFPKLGSACSSGPGTSRAASSRCSPSAGR